MTRTSSRRGALKRLLSCAAAAGAILVATPGIASADSGGEHILVYAAGAPGATRTVVASGVVNDIGYVVVGPSGPTSGSSTWVFPDGSLSISLNFTSTVSDIPNACRFSFQLSGTWRINSGTGAFAGATGGGTFGGPNTRFRTRTPDGCGEVYLQVTTFHYDGSIAIP